MTASQKRAESRLGLAQQLEAAGFAEADMEFAGAVFRHKQLEPDLRGPHDFCQLCIRTLKPRHRVWLREGVAACPCCASLPNALELIDGWLRISPDGRRRFIIQSTGIDPCTATAAMAELETSEYWEDQDGVPSGMRIDNHAGLIPGIRPDTYWDWARRRGML